MDLESERVKLVASRLDQDAGLVLCTEVSAHNATVRIQRTGEESNVRIAQLSAMGSGFSMPSSVHLDCTGMLHDHPKSLMTLGSATAGFSSLPLFSRPISSITPAAAKSLRKWAMSVFARHPAFQLIPARMVIDILLVRAYVAMIRELMGMEDSSGLQALYNVDSFKQDNVKMENLKSLCKQLKPIMEFIYNIDIYKDAVGEWAFSLNVIDVDLRLVTLLAYGIILKAIDGENELSDLFDQHEELCRGPRKLLNDIPKLQHVQNQIQKLGRMEKHAVNAVHNGSLITREGFVLTPVSQTSWLPVFYKAVTPKEKTDLSWITNMLALVESTSFLEPVDLLVLKSENLSNVQEFLKKSQSQCGHAVDVLSGILLHGGPFIFNQDGQVSVDCFGSNFQAEPLGTRDVSRNCQTTIDVMDLAMLFGGRSRDSLFASFLPPSAAGVQIIGSGKGVYGSYLLHRSSGTTVVNGKIVSLQILGTYLYKQHDGTLGNRDAGLEIQVDEIYK